MHNIGSLAALTSKALAKAVSDIRLIVNAQNTHAASAMVARRAAIEWWWVPSRASRAIELIPIIETARGLNKSTRSSLAAPASSRSLSASAIFTLDVIVSLEAGARQHAP
jgi:hypothetical protein